MKLACYVFHFFFPNKRFVLPVHSKPIFRNNKQSAIPRTLWQTNFTNRVTLAVYINYLFNRLLAYDFDYRFVITEDRAEFIKANYSQEIFDSYSRIQIGAAQADFWRLLVLYKHGGVYMDIDAHLVWPLSSIIKTEQVELYIVARKGDITNYFIASKNENSHLKQMIDVVLKNIKENTIKNVYVLTGPGIFNQVLNIDEVDTVSYRYACNQGNFTNDYFQYVDKAEGKWTRAQEVIDIIKK
ncbi:MAG: glycosyl transferase [Gammaproteobacteria bacterium]|nr:glycosyl transferase [Gammaproteobacteria bacterium]